MQCLEKKTACLSRLDKKSHQNRLNLHYIPVVGAAIERRRFSRVFYDRLVVGLAYWKVLFRFTDA